MVDQAEMIAETVRAVPGVHSLHGGQFGEIATYLPHRRVIGVRIDGDGAAIHVSMYVGFPLFETAERIRQEVLGHGVASVDVTIEDIVDERGQSS